MNSNDFGKLEQVDIRRHWPNEAADFTPWLDQNIGLLGKAIGLELEVEERESSVGNFSVDLVCKDEFERTVIVENQLEKTDYTHLGQLLTYAAGKDAAVIVWVSQSFKDEHRAALDWLNNSTGESIHFFGVQIEMWKIGESKPAPRFNIICKPNEWRETITGEMSLTQKRRFNFWTGLCGYMNEKGGMVNTPSPTKEHWMSFAIGRTGFHLNTLLGLRDDYIGVQLIISGSKENATAHYHLLAQQKDEIESEIDSDRDLEWKELPEYIQSQVVLKWVDCGINDEQNWGKFHAWMHEYLEKFYAAFHKRIQNLNAEDWQPPEEDDENEADEE